MDSEELRKFAETETRLLIEIKHPNVVAYRDCITDSDTMYLIMEYCDGGDLANKIKECHKLCRPLSEEQIVEWTLDLCLALQVGL